MVKHSILLCFIVLCFIIFTVLFDFWLSSFAQSLFCFVLVVSNTSRFHALQKIADGTYEIKHLEMFMLKTNEKICQWNKTKNSSIVDRFSESTTL